MTEHERAAVAATVGVRSMGWLRRMRRRLLRATNHRLPRLVSFPAWRETRFTDLLYSGLDPHLVEVVGVTRLEALESVVVGLVKRDAIHLQWTEPLVQPAVDEGQALARLERVTALFHDAADRGVRILWTIHNRAPHEDRFPDVERELMRRIGAIADVVHVLTATSGQVAVRELGVDPRKIRVIPHPSFLGVYPDRMLRAEARRRFGLAENDLAVLHFGQMRPYKGIPVLLGALGSLTARRPDLVLLMAGKVSEGYDEEIRRCIPPGLRLVYRPGFVPDSDVQAWFRAADIIVLPYRDVLNSGNVHLAATFGVPVLLPRLRALVDVFGDEAWVRFYDPVAEPQSLASAIDAFKPDPQLRLAAFRFAAKTSPQQVAGLFRELVVGLIAPPAR